MDHAESTEAERLLCGVLLMMPPIADYEAASPVLQAGLAGPRALEAAVWDAYRYAVLMPDGSRDFEKVLRTASHSAIASHALSLVALADGDLPGSLAENRKSRAIRPFPFNIVEGMRRDFSISQAERRELWRVACDLMISRNAESDPAVSTVEGALQRHWDNLILGTRVTSQVWSALNGSFGAD